MNIHKSALSGVSCQTVGYPQVGVTKQQTIHRLLFYVDSQVFRNEWRIAFVFNFVSSWLWR